MTFKTPMFHPNSKSLFSPIFSVYPDGKVCISILHAPGADATSGETAAERWRPIHTVESILMSVISMLTEPNIDSAANVDASVMYRDKREDYNKKVRRMA